MLQRRNGIAQQDKVFLERGSGQSSKSEVRSDWRVALLFAFIAILLYLPAINWGTPPADGLGRSVSWAPDEIGPTGPLVMVRNAVNGDSGGSAQYPLFHYIFVCIFYAPYLLFEMLRGGLRHPQGLYPYGFTDPVRAIHTLFFIARGVSILMGAGTVVVAYFTARTLWDRFTASLAATFVMLLFPMFFYARVSNVDVPAVFWTSLALFVFVRVLQRGLSPRRAVWLGLFSALAVATKDQYYAVIIVLPLILLPLHFRRMRETGSAGLWQSWKAPLAGLAVAVGIYGVASGLFIRPARFFSHLHYIRVGSGAGWYFKYPATVSGYWHLVRDTLGYLASSLSWPLLLVAVVGALLCLRRNRLNLSLLVAVPAIFLFVLVPVRFAQYRFLIIPSNVLALYAAFAIATGLRSPRAPLRWAAGLIAVFGCAFMLLHGAELTYCMVRDPRYEASTWLNAHTRDGDQIEIFSPLAVVPVYPRLNPGRQYISSKLGTIPGSAWLEGEFMIVLGQSENWIDPHYRAWVDRDLRRGTRGYLLVASFQNRSHFDFLDLGVNRRLDIFARRDRALELGLEAAGGGTGQ